MRDKDTFPTIATNTNKMLVGGLTIAFVMLKLMSHIDWSWAWVLSPLWIGVLIILVEVIITRWRQ